MSKGNGAGTPSGFTALDTADEPQATYTNDSIGASAIAIDGNDLIWVAFTQRAGTGTMQVETFDTTMGVWSTTPSDEQPTNYTTFGQGDEGVAIALDASGAPHVAFTQADSSGLRHVMYTNRVGGSWSTPLQVDDEAIPSGMNAMHPTIAFAADGSLLFAWLDGGAEYTAGTIRTRVRSASGTFSPSKPIGGQALSSIDDGPSLLITADGTRHLTFVDPNVYAKYWYSSDGITWNGDRQPPSQQTHDPSLGSDGASGVYIYGHGTPQGEIDGTGTNLYRFHLTAGMKAWSSFALWATGPYDCSVSTRWSQFFMRFPTELDSLYWNSAVTPNQLLLGEG